MTRAERTRRRQLIERATALLPELPVASLYRITALLEGALSGGEVADQTYDELERALDRSRRRSRRKGL